MEFLKDAYKLVPEKHRKPLLLLIVGAVASTWALAKLDERIDDKIKPLEKKHDHEMQTLQGQLKSIDDKLNIVIEKL